MKVGGVGELLEVFYLKLDTDKNETETQGEDGEHDLVGCRGSIVR